MRNLKSIALLLALMTICNSLKMYGQATSAGPGNTPFTAQDYNGWANGTLGLGVLTVPELTVKNEDPMPIGFYTGAGAGTFNNMRMRILGNYNGNGLIGIGDMGTGAAPFAPQQLLHQHYNQNASNFHQFTNLNTGVTVDDGLRVGLLYDVKTNKSIACFNLLENAPMQFFTNAKLQLEINETGQIKIENLKNDNLKIVCADKNGTLVLNNALQLITELQQQVNTLKVKISEMEKLMAAK
jgi:hypothetical protein